jgi:pimeloyl-ACP methyl ester carboxylesterase
VVGEQDEKFRAIAARMAEVMPSARVHVVAGAGHAAHLEAPDAVVELLAAAG